MPDRDRIKQKLGISVTTHDTNIDTLITAVQEYLKAYLGHDIFTTQKTEYFYCQADVFLKYGPVSSITSITSYNDDTDSYDVTYTTPDDYRFNAKGEVSFDTNLPYGFDRIRVIYEGYTAGPDVIDMGERLVMRLFRKWKTEGESTTTFDGSDVQWHDLLRPDDKVLLNNHRVFF